MTLPNSKAIEGNTKFTGLQRDWVKSYVAEVVSIEMLKLRNEFNEAIAAKPACSCGKKIKAVASDVADLQKRYSEDDKYSLTRGKIVALMGELGLD
jgi:hypothetical protein|tara:strand:+ start:351 stop:638 length:288 start_codon:yes stop_codon:yes gene_type:complete